jgi:transcriptional regulator with XRE-family HTH domain
VALDTTLRLLARTSGRSAADLAAAIPRVGAATVRAWMAGDKLPGREQLIALARALGIPAGALLSELATQLDPAPTRGESDLLSAYRGLSPRQQGALIEVAHGMAATRQRRRRPASKEPR